MDTRKILLEGVEWTDLAQVKDRWWTAVNTVIILGFP
jgi:hypothetical protein